MPLLVGHLHCCVLAASILMLPLIQMNRLGHLIYCTQPGGFVKGKLQTADPWAAISGFFHIQRSSNCFSSPGILRHQ